MQSAFTLAARSLIAPDETNPMKLRIFLGLLFAASTVTSFAQSRGQETLQFRLIQPCDGGNASFCHPYILAYGVIDAEAPARFERAFQRTPVSTIAFHSPGGNLRAGLEIGSRIRELGLNTVIGQPGYENASENWEFYRVGSSYKQRTVVSKAECYSACAFAFMGGVTRAINEGANYGLHQFSGSVNEDITQRMGVVLRRYFEMMGVSQRALDIVSTTSASSMRLLTVAEARELRIDNSKPSLSKWTVTATQSGEALVSLEQELSNGRTLGLRLRKRPEGIVLRVAQVLPEEIFLYRSKGEGIFRDSISDEHSGVKLEINGSSYATRKLSTWQFTRINGAGVMLIDLLLDERTLSALNRASNLELDASFANAVRDLNPSTQLGVTGLPSGLALLRNQR